ncbi:MAG: 4'-phosphopantetheinyl transferase family protein [Gammaproteobacteria bacterium]
MSVVPLDPESILGSWTTPRIRTGVVSVWAFTLAGSHALRARCQAWLSHAERERAARFTCARDRTEYLFAHGVLRFLLGRYSGVQPAALRFEVGPWGKPTLRTQTLAGAGLSFNLTHSGGRALLAVADGREIGIDLEKKRPDIEALSIARNYFFGSELEAIRGTPDELRTHAFFRYWTAKEAVIKGEGLGLSLPLDRFHVRFLSGNTRARVETLDESRLAPDWFVRTLPCEPAWSAAVAARGQDWIVKIEPG